MTDSRHPTLAHLRALPAELRRARLGAALRRAAAEAGIAQLALLPAFALASALRPDEPLWLRLALATWLLWLWPVLRVAVAARRAENRPDRIAAALDAANPDAPDVFRTAANLSVHSAQTLDALETLFRSWEPRLVMASPQGLGAARRRLLVGAGLLAAAIPVFSPNPPNFLFRAFLPLSALQSLPVPRLEPVGLPEVIARGDTLTAVVRVENVPAGRPVHLRIRRGDEEIRYAMTRNAAGDTATLRHGPVDADFAVRFSAGSALTSAHAVRVVAPPRLRALSVVVEPPAYTRLSTERLPGMPALLAVLPGTRVTLSAEAERPLREWAFVVTHFSEKSEQVGGASLRAAAGEGARFGFSRVFRHPAELSLHLRDREDEGGARAVEGPWRIALREDAPPEVTLLAPAPGSEGELPRSLKVPVLFRARDDFGVARVRLRYRVLRGGEEDVMQSSPRDAGSRDVTGWRTASDGTGGGVWDAAAATPEPGDVVELIVEAEDNDAVSGPKVARSAPARLRLPSAEEVRAALDARESGAVTSLSSALERERRMRREAERADKGNAAEPLLAPKASEADVRRILSDEPRRHLRELAAQLDAEVKTAAALKQAAQAPGRTPAERREAARREAEVNALKEMAAAMEKRVPGPEAARTSLAEQQKALAALNRDQQALAKALDGVRPPKPESSKPGAPPPRNLDENRARLESDLDRNLKDQQDLQGWLQDREKVSAQERRRAEQASKSGERLDQDVQNAMQQVEEALREGMENGALTPDVLEKMDRVRELLEEVLDAREKERLQREAGESPVESGDMQQAVRDLLERKEGLRQNLERAIRMLEAVRELRALRDAAADMRGLEEDQRALAKDVGKMDESAGSDKLDPSEKDGKAGESPAELAARQEALEKRLDAALKKMAALQKSAKSPAGRELKSENARKARESMGKTSDKLREKKPDRKASKAGADLAAQQLKAAAQEMEKMLAQLDAGSQMAEVRAVLEETLEFSRWLEGDSAAPPFAGPADAQAAVRIAKWLSGRMERLAAAAAFESELLRREASALSARADALSAAVAQPPAAAFAAFAALRGHSRGAARELLKMLGKPQSEGGSEEGDGQGDSDFGGGESGESGQEGISGRMKGVSGKQMAANRLTQELLRSLMRERQTGGSPGGAASGQPGGGRSGSSGASGESGGSGGRAGKAGQGEGAGRSGNGASGQPGGQGSAGNDGGESGSDGAESTENGEGAGSGAAANAQQRVASELESLAEQADDAGGAARTLRRLAEEARELEEALRRGRLDPGEIQRRQERFQTRLLESATALEERGQRQERRAEAYAGGLRPSNVDALPADTLSAEIRRRREEARKLPLTPDQRRRVEWYYERLLAP